MSTADQITKPLIFEYSNYRHFLRDVYTFKKATQAGFSYRVFSRIAGFSSPNFLKLVIEGERNLSPESLEKLLQALKLGTEEAAFFRSLVHLNQADRVEEKKLHAEQLIRSRSFRKLHPLKQALYSYYAHWYHVPIRELVATRDFQEKPEWIANALHPPITAAEARAALQTLLALGMLQRDDAGRLRQAEPLVSTGDEVSRSAVGQFHQKMIGLGAEAIDRFPSEERDISSLTLNLSEEGARQIKELVQRFRKELLAISSNETAPTRVYQLNFQVFPLSRKPEELP